ncbi:Gnk2-homologous domain [Dillenia turbinata]|uniref:non-specific serine/threonine protein kinase n=1 Tax=Dillenia turbinata TaxID=194707 RepID=A0AAN8UST5_9MAGN
MLAFPNEMRVMDFVATNGLLTKQKSSPFETNVKILLQNLSSNTYLSGFYNTTIGDGGDRIYGLAMCRGDVNQDACRNCVKSASQEIRKDCVSQDAIMWFELCQVRYSYQDFFSMMVYTGKYPDKWNDQQGNASNPAKFNNVLVNLMTQLSDDAAFDPSKHMFVTGEAKVSKKVTIYGLVQCTKDISGSDCKNCLNYALLDLQACCYSHEGGIIPSRNCNMRFGAQQFYNFTSSEIGLVQVNSRENWATWKILVVIFVSVFLVASLVAFFVFYVRWRNKTQNGEMLSQNVFLNESPLHATIALTPQCDVLATKEMPFMDLATIKVATDNFSDSNKLGQGGFGSVYKGVLPDGKEIAVKRLSRKSWQGLEEFKNEIILIAKLQHRNLVKLLGCGLEGQEKLLIYEFMPNKSLDAFIFNPVKGLELDWNTQYAMEGLFSVKSDVFSFGVIMLEIISGKRNSRFHLTEQAQTLLAYAWRLWNEEKELEFVDSLLTQSCPTAQVLKCIHIGLLCVQEDPADRPTMSSVLALLGNDGSLPLPQPKQPAFSVRRVQQFEVFSFSDPSVDDKSNSDF